MKSTPSPVNSSSPAHWGIKYTEVEMEDLEGMQSWVAPMQIIAEFLQSTSIRSSVMEVGRGLNRVISMEYVSPCTQISFYAYQAYNSLPTWGDWAVFFLNAGTNMNVLFLWITRLYYHRIKWMKYLSITLLEEIQDGEAERTWIGNDVVLYWMIIGNKKNVIIFNSTTNIL